MKNGRANGIDKITSEMIKALDEKGLKQIHVLCNTLYNSRYIPSDINDSVLVRLPKKAKAINCSDYRTLSLMSHVLKVLLKIILQRKKRSIEQEISETQRYMIIKKITI